MMTLCIPIACSLVLLCALPPIAFAQSTAEPKQSVPPAGPRITTAPSGVIVISGSSRRPSPPKAEPSATEPATTAEFSKKDAGARTVQPAAPKSPSERSVETTKYDATANRTPSRTSYAEHNSETSSSGLLTVRDINGGEVPYLSDRKATVSQAPGRKVSEQIVQRYDPGGNPTRKQVGREEVHTLADGTVETTRTILEEDLNGYMRPAERVISRETTTGSRTRTVTTVEKPSINGGFRAYLREESVETKSSESSAQLDVVRKLDDGAGNLVETEREQTTMTVAGGTSHSESTVWKRDYATNKMEFYNKTIAKRTERTDGSADESVEIYGFSIDDGSINTNTTSPQLQRTIERQVRVSADGEKVEISTTRSRSVADQNSLGLAQRVKKVVWPSANGETIETQVYEQGVNGNLVPTEVIVERVKK